MGERFTNADGRIDNGERIVPSIVGIGATGISTVNALISSGMPYADFWAIDTVPQTLEKALGPAKSLYITPEGAENAIREVIQASFADIAMRFFCAGDLLVIIASLDDKTSIAFAPIVARIAKELGALGVISIVTIPLSRGLMTGVSAENCLIALRCHVDMLLPFSIDRLRTAADPALQFHAQEGTLLSHATKGIVEPFAYTNYISLDFADLRSMFNKTSVVGMGMSCGEDRGWAAAAKALADPLLAGVLPYADSVLVNITGWNIHGNEISVILETVAAACCNETNIAFVDCNLEVMGEKLRVTIFAGCDAPAI